MSRKVAFVSIAILFVAGATWAQWDRNTVPPEPDRLGTGPPDAMTPLGTDGYGIQDYAASMTVPHAFQPFGEGLGYLSWVGGYIGPRTGDTWLAFNAPIDLPSGALLNSVIAMVYDNDATGKVRLYLIYNECETALPCTASNLVDVETGVAETPGYTIMNSSDVMGMTWKNYEQSPPATANCGHFRVVFSDDSTNLRVGPIWIWYQRQISPAPAAATFPDVGTGFWAFREIEALASSGITTGFPDGTFRPLEPVTRAQMATFLARALGLHYEDYSF